MKSAGWNFNNTYQTLPSVFFEKINPVPVANPKVVIFNHDLATELNLNPEALKDDANTFSGNKIPDNTEALSQAYAGHQFGHFTLLGDGRANLLGEHLTKNNERFDIQLKGSGPNKYSRRGDGRAAIGPMLREYIISEAMHGLNIPTTRSLAVVTTGEHIQRETSLPGAILTRVASSHIRVGTFEFAAIQNDPNALKALADYTIHRHFPKAKESKEPYLTLLEMVIERQAKLIAQWMNVGFIHGVMNTDNMAISGQTIDYGPCAFMDTFNRTTVFSSIDHQGRYAYGNQPPIAEWNLTRFAESLIPILSQDQAEAIKKAESALESFAAKFSEHMLSGIKAKIGLTTNDPEDIPFIEALLKMMEDQKADYTNTFRDLSKEKLPTDPIFQTEDFKTWHKTWLKKNPDFTLMKKTNPQIIPRNYKVEEALEAATKDNDYTILNKLVKAIKNPFEESTELANFLAPKQSPENYQTFCGT